MSSTSIGQQDPRKGAEEAPRKVEDGKEISISFNLGQFLSSVDPETVTSVSFSPGDQDYDRAARLVRDALGRSVRASTTTRKPKGKP